MYDEEPYLGWDLRQLATGFVVGLMTGVAFCFVCYVFAT